MRRIPRCQRSIDQSLQSAQLVQSRATQTPCRSGLATIPIVRSTSAPFSSSTRYNGFLDGQQDKRKHQQFVRRWQKRLLGDAEPIGAHVDPYDPNSPVRISQEEQGEEQEVLDAGDPNEQGLDESTSDYGARVVSSRELKRVGGKEWRAARAEDELEDRYFKLLAVDDYVANYSFGPDQPITQRPGSRQNTDPAVDDVLREKFHQAVVEVYTLKQAGLDFVVPVHADTTGGWTQQVQLAPSVKDGVTLTYHQHEDRDNFLKAVQSPLASIAEEGTVTDRLQESPQQQVEQSVEEVGVAADQAKEPSTQKPAIKKTGSKSFDFMSNRPVPRAQPAEPIVEEGTSVEPIQQKEVSEVIGAAYGDTHKTDADLRHESLVAVAELSERAISDMRKEVRDSTIAMASEAKTATKYGDILLTDPNVKFAMTKRLLQLTGLRISDPALNSSRTLGDLYNHFTAAARPKPKTLYETIMSEVKFPRGNRKAKAVPVHKLRNVTIHPKRVGWKQQEKAVGRWKVIQYALAERDLATPRDLKYRVPRVRRDAEETA